MDRLPAAAIDSDTSGIAPTALLSSGRGQVIKIIGSVTPWLIIAGLLWAGFFIKPQPVGSTVKPPVIERRDFFYGLAVPAPDVLWVAGTNGKVVRSENGGALWNPQVVPGKAHLQDISAWDSRHAVAVGNKGVIVVTVDGGTTWMESPAPKSDVANKLMRVLTLPDRQAWTVGEMGALLHSIDFGKSWQRMRAEEDVGWNDVTFAGSANGWVVGEFGRALRTVDGGTTWVASQTPATSSLMGVAFRDDQNGVAVGLEGVVLVTQDGGTSWHAIKSGTQEHLLTVAWDAVQRVWIAAGNLGVWVRGDAAAENWVAGRLDERDLSWHTKVVVANGKTYFAGSTVGHWNGKQWQVVTNASALQAATTPSD
ncbi:WD40/YVTN/BNR-like repeat-containing protein [Actimicrobium antarcticum]|uniref:Photosynthesis system II assembly factor Ycf48/Hcf136-like domain-containing protein n=1 Tax=Actimicrobium antarcticum TaxID=1051899 RepID=A0ABP7SXI8_9BURK